MSSFRFPSLRKVSLALAVASVSFASAPVMAEPLTPEKAAQQVAVARSFYSLINGGASDAWRRNVDTAWKATPPMPSRPDQLGGYESVIGTFRGGIPDLKVEQVEVIANEDVVAVRSRVTGTNTAPMFGQPATGRSVTFTAMDIHRIKDGKIVETWHVEDLLSMQRQLSGK
jgi:predicted ester cyclase